MTPAEQATQFVSSLNKLIKTQREEGVSTGVILVCLLRMGAAFAMDSGVNSRGFGEMAEEEFQRVPMQRKFPSNVVELPKGGKS